MAPGGIYSAKYKSLTEIPNGAKIGIPNDPANESRALALLHKSGLIKLKDGSSINASVRDIAENPKRFDIVLLDEIMLPRSLDDLKAAFVTLNKGVLAGLDPETAIVLEDKTSPWAIVWAARNDKVEDPEVVEVDEVEGTLRVPETALHDIGNHDTLLADRGGRRLLPAPHPGRARRGGGR